MLDFKLVDKPLDSAGRPRPETKKHHLNRLHEAGIRPVAYPYTNILSIVNDIDAATREKFLAYHHQISLRHGLDFGNSFWLFQLLRGRANFCKSSGIAVFGPDFNVCPGEWQAPLPGCDMVTYDLVLSTNETVREFHRGRLDHFHSFCIMGPKAQQLNPEIYDNVIIYKVPKQLPDVPFLYNLMDFFSSIVFNINNKAIVCGEIKIKFQNNYIFYSGLIEDNKPILITQFNTRQESILYNDIVSISVTTQGRQVAHFGHCFMVHVSSEQLAMRVGDCIETYGIGSALLTGHSGFHISTGTHKARLNQRQADALRNLDAGEIAVSLVGQIRDPSGAVLLETDADHPASVTRAVPEVTDALGVSFVIPCGFVCLRAQSLELFDLVFPAIYQDGSPVYMAARVNTYTNGTPVGGQPGKSIADVFEAKLTAAMDSLDDATWHAAPLYTHLGIHVDKTLEAASLQREAYFSGTALQRAMRSHFGMPGLASGAARNWFLTASCVYQYVYALLHLPDHTRRDGDTIAISDWVDPHTSQRQPRSVAQLYGVTFYVEDAETARVTFNGRPVHRLGRNPADATGRQSVTILEAAVDAFIDEIDDPYRTAGPRLDGHIETRIVPVAGAEPDIGQAREIVLLSPRTPDAPARLAFAVDDCGAIAPQVISFLARADAGVRMAMRIETANGVSLFIGQEELRHAMPASSADSVLSAGLLASGQWTGIAIALGTLTWRDDALSPDQPPNSTVTAIEIALAGPAGARLHLAALALSRPRAAVASDKNGYCVMGTAMPGEMSSVIAMAPVDDPHAVRLAASDRRGIFLFPNVPHGAYAVWKHSGEADAPPPPRKVVYVRTNRTDIVL